MARLSIHEFAEGESSCLALAAAHHERCHTRKWRARLYWLLTTISCQSVPSAPAC